MRVAWQFSSNQRVKVNADGSVRISEPKATVGGVIRGPNGGWVGVLR